MLIVVSNCWALFLGMGLIMLGNGLQTSLLGVRASMEGFGTSITGLVMSGHFIGLIIGCQSVPKLVSKVGHVRTFGALASLASTSILVQAIWVNPLVWLLMRIVTGFSYAGMYIVVESWINDAADNGSRGRLLSIYMLVSLGGMAGGQLLLNLFPPSGFELFLLISLLISLALIPILLSTAQAPKFDVVENINILQLYKVSPIGVFGMFVTGMTIGAFYGMGPVYATLAGFSVKNVSYFMGALILGGFIFQYPLGWLSDLIGRRRVILLCCIGGAVTSLIVINVSTETTLFVVASTIGGLAMPLYSLCSVHTNDFLTPTQMVAASGTLVLLSALGASIGAPITALAMETFGPQSFFVSIGIMLIAIGIFVVFQISISRELETMERGDFTVMVPTPLSAALNIDVELDEMTAAADEEEEDIKDSFDQLVQGLDK